MAYAAMLRAWAIAIAIALRAHVAGPPPRVVARAVDALVARSSNLPPRQNERGVEMRPPRDSGVMSRDRAGTGIQRSVIAQ